MPCINSVQGTSYLNEPAVKAALHVDSSPNTWQICGGVQYTDDGVYDSMIAVHKDMLERYAPRVLVYNGDVDPGVNRLKTPPPGYPLKAGTDLHNRAYDRASKNPGYDIVFPWLERGKW